MRAAIGLWASREGRRRWGSLLVIAGLCFVTTTATLVAGLGAVRAPDSFARLRDATGASDWQVFAGDDVDPDAVLATVRSLPGVTDAAMQFQLFVTPSIHDYYPDYHLLAIAPRDGADTIDRPVIVSGRRPDPSRTSEIALNERMATALDKRPGDHLTLESVTDAWVEEAFNGAAPEKTDGPTIDVEIVGITRSPADRGRYTGIIELTPAFVDEYGAQMRTSTMAGVRAAGEPQLPDDFEVSPSIAADDGKTDDGLDTIATGMWIVTLLAALTGLAVIAQVALATARAALRERTAMNAMGWTRRNATTSVVLLMTPAALLGVITGAAASVALSPLALVGLARAVDPHPNAIVIEPAVVAIGGAAIALVALAAITMATSMATRAEGVRVGHPSRLRIDHPVPSTLGVRSTFSRDARAGANRSSLVIAAIGTVGIVAALTVGASIDRLADDPELSGQGGGRSIDSGESTEVLDQAMPILDNDDRVAMLAALHIFFPSLDDGTTIGAIAVDMRKGEIDATTLRGRIPSGADEIAVGPQTLDDLGIDIGDRLALTGSQSRHAEYRVVGTILFPEGDFDFDSGVAMSADAAKRLIGDPHDGAAIHSVEYDWADGVNGAEADASLGFEVFFEEGALVPPPVANLGEVVGLTRFLAVLFALLALGGLTHGLLTGARRQRHNLGVLRALGLRTRGITAMLATATLTILAAGIVVGLPVGLVVANLLWTNIATRAHLVVQTVVPVDALILAGAVMVVAVACIAVGPTIHASRVRPADALRVE